MGSRVHPGSTRCSPKDLPPLVPGAAASVPSVGAGVPPLGTLETAPNADTSPEPDASESSFRRDAKTNARDRAGGTRHKWRSVFGRAKHPPRILLLAALLLCIAFLPTRAVEPDIFSQVVSYQYPDTLAEPGTPIISSVVSYQYFDWPGDENLTFTNSPNVSYYFNGAPQILAQPLARVLKVGQTASFAVTVEGSPPLSYQWRLNGVNLPAATGAAIALSNLQLHDSGSYSVVVQNAHGSVASHDAALTVYLAAPGAPPPLPVLVAASQTLSPAQIQRPLQVSVDDSLKVFFNNTNLRADARKMTIVMTHGWNAKWTDWPTEMADTLGAKLYVNGQPLRDSANIVAWDWETDANLVFLNPVPSTGQTLKHGEALGRALVDALGPDYNKPIHFLGHSLGTMVNCRAVDFLHGNAPKNRPAKSAGAFLPAKTHLTLFDEAELAAVGQRVHFLTDILLSGAGFDVATEDAVTQAKSPAKVIPTNPDQCAWIDNYISEFGWLQREAANVMLFRRLARPLIDDLPNHPPGLHGYSYDWYKDSITTPFPPGLRTDEAIMGFYYSFERGSLQNAHDPGTYFQQNILLNSSPLRLKPIDAFSAGILSRGRVAAYPTQQRLLGLQAKAQRVAGAVQDGIQYAGTLIGEIKESFSQPRGNPVYVGAGSTPAYFTDDAPADSAPQAHWDLEFSISPGAPNPQQLRLAAKATAVASAPADTAVYTIIPVHVPLEAVGVSFQYQVTGTADDDFMTMGIGAENNFSMEARYIGNGEWNSTPVIQVADFRDQDIQLVFALNGVNGPPAGALSVRNIQFYIPPRPRLTLGVVGSELTVSWPLSAIAWTLETTSDLSLPNGWQPEAGLPEDTDSFHTMTFDISTTPNGFFRLRK